MHCFWRDVDFRDHNEKRDLQCQRDAQVLLGHHAHSHLGSDDDHAVVRHQAHKPKHRCLEVLLMATQVKESHQLLRVGGDVSPRLVLGSVGPLRCDDFLFVEAHDLLSDAGRPSIAEFVREVEDLLPREASAIVHNALCEHSNERTLSRVDVADDSHSDVSLVSHSHSAFKSVELVLKVVCFLLLLLRC